MNELKYQDVQCYLCRFSVFTCYITQGDNATLGNKEKQDSSPSNLKNDDETPKEITIASGKDVGIIINAFNGRIRLGDS